MSLGTNISRLRAEHHLSQGDLAEALAVSRQSVSKWETDSSVPDLDKLVKLSQVFDVTLDELVMGAEPQPKAETPPQQVVVSHRMPGRKIAGTILFCMGFLAFLIPTMLDGLLTGAISAVPSLVCGIIFLLAHKGPGLWCAWAVYLLAYIICYYGTGLGWNLLFFTFSWEAIGIPAYTIAAWVQVLMILALLIGTVRSFRTFSFPPTRRNGVILAVLWVVFLVCWLLISPVLDLMLELGKSAVLIVVLIFTVQVLVSLILLAIALTLSVRMFAAWRASRR